MLLWCKRWANIIALMFGIIVLLSALSQVNGGTNRTRVCTDVYGVPGDTYCSCQNYPYTCACHLTEAGCRDVFRKPQCYTKSERCNEFNFCGDWSDERNCSCPSGTLECDCHKTVAGCRTQFPNMNIGRCMPKRKLCNRFNDCGDWTDEKNCTCEVGLNQCACNNTGPNTVDGCFTRNDWILQCYDNYRKCDGYDDCGDWSDERNCSCAVGLNQCPCNHTGIGTKDGCIIRHGKVLRCYENYQKCDGYDDCGDWSDERNCSCAVGSFQCPCNHTAVGTREGCITTGTRIHRCYEAGRKCDRNNDCGDWSDEKNCPEISCPTGTAQCTGDCRGGFCPPKDVGILQCFYNGGSCISYNNCGNWSVDMNCTCYYDQRKCGCITNPKNCTSRTGCVSRSQILNGVPDCPDFSDEACVRVKYGRYEYMFVCENRTSYEKLIDLQNTKRMLPRKSWETFGDIYTTDFFICRNVSIYSYDKGHHEVYWCNYNYTTGKTWDTLRCADGNFIEELNFCSGNNICWATEKVDYPGFKCRAKARLKQTNQSCVLPQINLYNSFSICADGSDICFVNGKLKCFKCLDGKLLLSPNQVCDGVVDCFDLSDECLCGDQTTCTEVLGNSRQVCKSNEMLCNGICMATSKVLCNAEIKCNGNVNTKYCLPTQKRQVKSSFVRCSKLNGKNIGLARKCNGIPECWNREDECIDCPVKSHFCEEDIMCHHDMLLNNMKYCDGKEKIEGLGKFSWKCKHGFDEINCTNRFYCKIGNLISISFQNVCDGVEKCDDGSDELISICKNRRFYCLNGNPASVELTKVENGIKDCSDGSDECPANSNKTSIFSSPLEMISYPYLRVIIWIMGLLALLGNSVVFVGEILELRNNKNPVAIINHLYILNLSFSDFLMGVYLLSISIKGVMFSGSYCYHDLAWRSSSTCSFLGALVVTSTEASALIMTLMTTFRLLTVCDPIGMTHLSWKRLSLPLILVWIASVLLGTIPLLPLSSGYFVSSLWFPNYFYSQQSMRKEDIKLLIGRMTQNSNRTFGKLNWSHIKETLGNNFKSLEVKGEFGYYSKTSVCLPRLFVKVGDTAWEYSTMLITLNFCMFIYMVISYVIIYKRGTTMKKSKQNDKNKNLQKRITRLIVTDFLCWIPLCIMAYINLAGVTLNSIVYVISAAGLLPINSTINPLLYSKQLEVWLVKVFNKVKLFCKTGVKRPKQ